jgi:hypothetical protein
MPVDPDDVYVAMWARWAAEAAGVSYEELVARLEAGSAALQISVTIPSDKPRWPCPGA